MRVSSLGLFVAVVVGCLCCGGSGPSEPVPTDGQLFGTWRLRTINNVRLPYDIPSFPGQLAGDRYQVYDGVLTFAPGITSFIYADSNRYLSTGGSVSKYVTDGVGYVLRNGSTLELKSSYSPLVIVARLVGDSLRVSRDTLDLVYTR